MYIILFFLELMLLFLLSQKLTKEISGFFHQISRNNKITIYLLALLFLPGTTVHELAHFIMAKFLFVYAGKIRLWPEASGNEVKLGSVAIGKTDPVRRFLIGTAPFIYGLTIIISVIFLLLHYNLIHLIWLDAVVGFVVFQIGNTMFSSRKDLEGTIWLLIVSGTIIAIIYFTGIRISLQKETITMLNNLFKQGCFYLLFPIGFDSIIILLSLIFRK